MAFAKHGLIVVGLVVAGWTLVAESAPEVVVTGGRIRGEHLAAGGAAFKGCVAQCDRYIENVVRSR